MTTKYFFLIFLEIIIFTESILTEFYIKKNLDTYLNFKYLSYYVFRISLILFYMHRIKLNIYKSNR